MDNDTQSSDATATPENFGNLSAKKEQVVKKEKEEPVAIDSETQMAEFDRKLREKDDIIEKLEKEIEKERKKEKEVAALPAQIGAQDNQKNDATDKSLKTESLEIKNETSKKKEEEVKNLRAQIKTLTEGIEKERKKSSDLEEELEKEREKSSDLEKDAAELYAENEKLRNRTLVGLPHSVPINIQQLLFLNRFEVPCGLENTITPSVVREAFRGNWEREYCRQCLSQYLTDGVDRPFNECTGHQNQRALTLFKNIKNNDELDKRTLRAKFHCPNKPCNVSVCTLAEMEEHLLWCRSSPSNIKIAAYLLEVFCSLVYHEHVFVVVDGFNLEMNYPDDEIPVCRDIVTCYGGYSVTVQIHRGGFETGKGTHLSVYYQVSAGDPSSDLCDFSVTVRIWDQNTKYPIVMGNSFYYRRREYLQGCPCFISHEQLRNRPGLVVGGTAILSVEIALHR